MQSVIKAPLFSNMSDVQFKLNDFCWDFADDFIGSEKSRPEKESVYEDEKGIWHYDYPFCKHCDSRRVIKHGKNSRTIFKEENLKQENLCKKIQMQKMW